MNTRLASGLALALLAGCARFVDRPLSPAATAESFQSRNLADAELRRRVEARLGHPVTPWPPKAWDSRLLTLAALHFHPDLALARAQHVLAEAAEITAAQRPNPTLSFSPTYVTQITSAPFNPWILGANPDIPIETAGKRDQRIAHAQHLTESARLKIAGTAWAVRSRLRASLLNLFAARNAEALRTRQLSAQEEWTRLLEERQRSGEISGPEVTVGRLAQEQTRMALGDARRQSAEAWAQLADALGVPPLALDGVEVSLDDFERVPPVQAGALGEIRRQALFNRADLLAALADYEASQSALQLEVAKQYPDLHIGPGMAFNQGEYKWILGVTLTLPVLNQNQGPIAEAEARRKDAAARFESLQARIVGEIARALAGASAARQRLAAADDLLAAQEKQARSAAALFQAGETDRLALVSSRVEQAASELSRLDALVKAQQAVGLLEDALQKPLDVPPTTF